MDPMYQQAIDEMAKWKNMARKHETRAKKSHRENLRLQAEIESLKEAARYGLNS